MQGKSVVGIVLVNFNGRRFLNDCVRALSASHERRVDIVVVDNDSTDDSLALLSAEFPNVTVLPQGRNLGVAAANNVGIRYCLDRADFVLLLNYDTLPAENLIGELLRVADPGTLVSGSTYFWNDSTRSNSHAGGFDWALGRLRERFFGRSDASLGTEVVEVEIADTCCLLVPRDAFTRAGLMDEAYFLVTTIRTSSCVRGLPGTVASLIPAQSFDISNVARADLLKNHPCPSTTRRAIAHISCERTRRRGCTISRFSCTSPRPASRPSRNGHSEGSGRSYIGRGAVWVTT